MEFALCDQYENIFLHLHFKQEVRYIGTIDAVPLYINNTEIQS